jgi:predicted nuclease of restriction endonuclease-like (RecB) superfamily
MLFSLFIIGCSNFSYVENNSQVVTRKLNKNFDESKLKNKYKNLYDNWELDTLKFELETDEQNIGVNKVIETYKHLLSKKIKNYENLQVLIETIKKDLEDENIDELQSFFVSSPKNFYFKKKLNTISLEEVNIFVNEPKLYKHSATNIIGLNYLDRTEYFDISYVFKNSVWKIKSVTEKIEKR